jgi:hypothetical protein
VPRVPLLVGVTPFALVAGGGEVDHLRVGAPHTFRLAPDRGRDLPVADSGGLPTPGADFDLTGSHGDDSYDWKLRKEQVRVPLAGSH